MKKDNKLTDKIMNKVVTFEKKRTRFSLWKILVFLIPLFIVLSGLTVIVFRELQETQTLDLLSLLGEDREIISDYWQETVQTFLLEIPLKDIVTAVFVIVVILVSLWLLRKKLALLRRRIVELAKYKKSA
ncbi:hypothetical protein HY045_01615 [Candidatus Woesebacteria bacterium]|nr:hypothetical protein [Candidatus Woesebacteria bacterium]